jgi:hypothetical protein
MYSHCINIAEALFWQYLSFSLIFYTVYQSVFKMDLLEIGVNVVGLIGLAQDRYRWRALVNSVMNLWVP